MRKSFLMLVFAAGCGPGNAADGEVVYTNKCGECHGSSGDAEVAQESTNNTPAAKLSEEVPEKTDDELRQIITEGYDDIPAVDDISDEEIDDLIAYLRKTF